MNFSIGTGQLQTQRLSQTQIQSVSILQMSAQELSEFLENAALSNPVMDL